MAQPDNYSSPLVQALQGPQPDLGGALLGGYQQGLMRPLQMQQIQQQVTQQQEAFGAQQAALNDPSPANIVKWGIADPTHFEAIKASHDAMTSDQRNQDVQDATSVYGYLQAGNADGAAKILQQRVDAGQTGLAPLLGMINSGDPAQIKQAQAAAGMILAGKVGPDKFAEAYNALGTNARDNAELPGKIKLTAAQTAQAQAEAAQKSFLTVPFGSEVRPIQVGAPGAAPGASPGVQPASGGAQPRGVRNNNPVNVTALPNGQKWDGQTGTDGSYATFATPEAGMAAADKNLQAYATKHGINTIAGVVNRWAPSSDGNDPVSYAATVAKAMGIAPDQKINLANPNVRKALLTAMSGVELGQPGAAKAMAGGAAPASSVATDAQGNTYSLGAPVSGGGGEQDALLPPKAIAMVGQQYLSMGPEALKNLGQGPIGQVNKAKIMKWVADTAEEAGTSNPQLVARFAQNKANVEALGQNTKTLAAVTSSLNTIDANLDLAETLAKRGLGPTGVPMLDTPINKLRSTLGSADAKTLDNVMKGIAAEQSKLMTTTSGTGGQTTDRSMIEGQGMINAGMNLRQIIAAGQAIRTEGQNRRNGIAAENARLTSEISGVPQAAPAAPAAAPTGSRLSPAQAQALKPGTPFIGMDGVPRVRH